MPWWNRYRVFILLFFSGISQLGYCWENFPEFQSLTETEQQTGFEGPSLLDSEYFSDILTYTKPPAWEYLWLVHPRAFDVSLGSLNTRRFMMDHRLKIRQPLSDRFEFRFTYFDESNLERQSIHHILEIIFWPWKKVGISAYGEPSFRKPNDDTGLALLLRPSDQHEIRIFNTFVDVTRLKYPDTPDTFIEPDLPYARGIVGRAWSKPKDEAQLGHFLEYAFRHETPTLWEFSEQNYLYRYWKLFTSLYARYQFSQFQSIAFRMQFDRKHESRSPTGSTTTEMGSWYTNRLTALGETTFYRLGPGQDWSGTLGLQYVGRHWVSDQGLGIYRDLLPYLSLRIPTWGPPSKKDHWILGYILTWHREHGSEAIGIRPGADGQIEQRFNLAYEFYVGEGGRLVLLASANMNEFGTRKTWGGGSGQLQLFF